jgi:ABC-type uncharacterized transport system ATPase subunit
VLFRVEKPAANPGAALLEVEGVRANDDRGVETVRGLSLTVHAGEIVGLAGVDGNGQSELAEVLSGLRRPTAGAMRVGGKDTTGAGVTEILELHDYDREPNSRLGWLFPSRLVARAKGLLQRFDVRGGGAQTLAAALSGGNQQKVVLAREIGREPRVLLAVQPTRGLDVGAIEFVHQQLVAARDAGLAVLLVSLELDEILSLSDRILAIYEGRIVAEYRPDVTPEELGIAMTGGLTPEETAA